MFSTNLDGFQFAFYGFATLAASVGYAWRRTRSRPSPEHESLSHAAKRTDNRRSNSPPHQPHEISPNPNRESDSCVLNDAIAESQSPPEAADSTPRKRKFSEDDYSPQESDTDPSSIYPNKRSKTPSDTDSELVKTPLADEPLIPEVTPKHDDSTVTSQDICEQAELDYVGSNIPIMPISEPAIQKTIEVPLTPASYSSQPNTRPATPSAKSVTRSQVSATGGFASFANVDSPFRTSAETPASKKRSVWQGGKASEAVAHANPLAAEPVLQNNYSHITGEENETVESELKGVQLFVKQGSKDFTNGLIGHIKLLSRNDSEDERLLFRREPLWQVSMNLRLHPLVRCSFDEESSALRLIAKVPVERVGTPVEQWPQEIAIYVVKRGRAPKEAFRKFADMLLANKHLNCPGSAQ